MAIALGTASAFAQNQLDFSEPIIPEAAAFQSGVKDGHSLSFTILGLEYSYEKSLGGDWSLIFRAGLPQGMISSKVTTSTNSVTVGGVTQSQYSKTAYYQFGPVLGVSLEPRYYTNLTKRALRGKKTENNCGDFIALKTTVYTQGYGIGFHVIPVYGFRRGNAHWFREYTLGAGYHGIGNCILPHANFRIGYTF